MPSTPESAAQQLENHAQRHAIADATQRADGLAWLLDELAQRHQQRDARIDALDADLSRISAELRQLESDRATDSQRLAAP